MSDPARSVGALFVNYTAELGGGELFLVGLLEAAVPGWGACFLEPGPAAEALRAAGCPVVVAEAGGRVSDLRRGSSPMAALGAVRQLVGLARTVRRAARTTDVVVANSQKALVVAALATLGSRRRLVWILHDILTDPSFGGANRRAVVAIANHRAACVVANSQATADAFVACGGRRDLVRVVHNGFALDGFRPATPEDRRGLRDEFGLDGRPVVGVFGRLTRWKGQEVAIRAMRDLDAQLLVVGAATLDHSGHEAVLRELVRAEGLEDRVVFAGFRPDVARLMAACDVVVHASTGAEPFGRVVVEAMLSGTPVVATRAGGVPEIVREGGTGTLVEPGRPAELADAIGSLLADPERAALMARTARAEAQERFAIGTIRASIASVLAEAARPA